LARRPKILLLDEPLAALDKKLRETTQGELKALQERLGMTFIIVTHDQEEAMTLADRIGVMDKGRLVQVATPRDLYETPNSRWIAGFVGDINLIDGHVAACSGDRVTVVTTDAGALVVTATGQTQGSTVCLAIRPEKIRLDPVVPASTSSIEVPNAMPGEVAEVGYLGGTSVYKVKLESGVMLRVAIANASRGEGVAIDAGARVVASFDPEDAVVLTS
jgi:putrescine transport system ATP-binding protein